MDQAATRMSAVRARIRKMDGRGIPERIVLLAIVLAVWEWYGHQVSSVLLVPPSKIVERFQEMVLENVLLEAVGTTMLALILGVGLAIVVGVAVGIAIGRWRRLGQVVDPYVAFFYALPLIALQPLFVIWFGIGPVLKVAMVFAFAVVVIIINTAAGVREVQDRYLDVARSVCASEGQVVRTILMPSALPYIMTGIRLGLAQGLIGVIVVEMTAAITGLGGQIITAGNVFDTAGLFVPIIVVMLLAVVLTGGLRWLHQRVTPWENPKIT